MERRNASERPSSRARILRFSRRPYSKLTRVQYRQQNILQAATRDENSQSHSFLPSAPLLSLFLSSLPLVF
jgi:hypothetical protein